MARRPRCVNCEAPVPSKIYGRNRAISSFCTMACGAEFAERVLRSTPDVATLLVADDPLAERLQLARGCGKYRWQPGTDAPDGELGGRWVVCTGGKQCPTHHPQADTGTVSPATP